MAKFRGMHPPRKGPLPFRYVLLISFVFFMFSTAAGLWLVNEGIEPTLKKYAQIETERVAMLAINKAINKKVTEGIDVEKLWITKVNNDNEITMINLNTSMVNKISSETTNLVQENLILAEQGRIEELRDIVSEESQVNPDFASEGIIQEIPLGLATKMAILGNLGPKIPVKFTTVGDAFTDVIHEVKEFGINNFQIIVSVHVVVNVQVIIPFAIEVTTVENTIPIGSVVLPGKVPDFFNNSGDGVVPSVQLNSD